GNGRLRCVQGGLAGVDVEQAALRGRRAGGEHGNQTDEDQEAGCGQPAHGVLLKSWPEKLSVLATVVRVQCAADRRTLDHRRSSSAVAIRLPPAPSRCRRCAASTRPTWVVKGLPPRLTHGEIARPPPRASVTP